MNLCFKLSMPSSNTWNNRWSGQGKLYVKVINFRGAKREKLAKAILRKQYFSYNFGDGWRAGIDVYHIDETYPQNEPARLRRKSAGFCGYDWMVESIITDLTIIAPSDREKLHV